MSIGVADRRRKDPEELEHVRQSQQATEQIIERTCRLIARAEARRDGVLLDEGRPLTSERVRAMINHWFIDLGYVNPPSIIAGGPVGADCHDLGHGELRTGEPVIVDIFPRNETTLYYGDCTRIRRSWRRARRSASACTRRSAMPSARGWPPRGQG